MSEPVLHCMGPAWGLDFSGAGPGLVAPDVMLFPGDPEIYALVESITVHDERRAAAGGRPIVAPPCLAAYRELPGGTDPRAALQPAIPALLGQLSDAVLALRLARAGWFLDPALVSLTFNDGAGNLLLRRPGPYAQAMLGGTTRKLPPMHVELADLSTPDANGPVFLHGALLAEYRADTPNTAADIALSQFDRSYALVLAPVDRCAMLFTAIDAMFVGMSARRMGRINLRRFGFRKRVESALLASGQTPEVAACEAGWLDWAEGGRGLRNAIAHGDRTAAAAADAGAVVRLQAIVRAVLPGFLTFSVRWTLNGEEWAGGLGIPPTANAVAAYNRALERGYGDATAPPWVE